MLEYVIVDRSIFPMSQKIFIALFDQSHGDDEEEGHDGSDGRNGTVNAQLGNGNNQEVEIGYPSKLLK